MNRKLEKRVPIRRRVLVLFLVTLLVGLLAASVTGVFCISWIKESTEKVLTSQIERNLKNMVLQKAIAADARLEHYEKYIEFVTDYIEDMYRNRVQMIARGYIYDPPVDTHDFALTRGFINDEMKAEDFREELFFFSNLEQVLAPIATANEKLITTLYVGSKSGLMTSYDRFSYLSVPEPGHELVYDFFHSSWYQQGMKEKGVFYTDLYLDSQGRGMTITVASPFLNENGEFEGVNCADFDITALFFELLSVNAGENAMSFALDKNGALISPDAQEITLEAYTGLKPEDLERLRTTPDGIIKTESALYVSVPIERVGWTLCVSVPTRTIHDMIQDSDRYIVHAYLVFVGIAILIILVAVFMANRVASIVTRPIEQLGRDMRIISDGDLTYRAPVRRNDEIGDVTSQMNEMVDRLQFTMRELLSSQQHADAMSRLATVDALTGVRNKTAYDERIRIVEKELAEGKTEFGLVMIDLNYLKVINDNYGHEKGNVAIKTLCKLICEVFAHSPVFRIGGDEFVVLLEGADYQNVDNLLAQFKNRVRQLDEDKTLAPWTRVSAAIGYARYDARKDTGTDSVLARADQEMYRCKGDMKRK
ncbi:MAG: diguanylate cyclase [Clostridia bacterium]|nr:diguanylate cyclase [Clostridia bacterium]